MVRQRELVAAAVWKAHRLKPGRRGPRQGWPGRSRPAAQMGAGRRHSGPVSLSGPFYHRYLLSARLLPGGLGRLRCASQIRNERGNTTPCEACCLGQSTVVGKRR